MFCGYCLIRGKGKKCGLLPARFEIATFRL